MDNFYLENVLDPNEIPDCYDNEGNLNVNSWKLLMDEELSQDED